MSVKEFSKYVQHPAGVWQDKVNFIIHIHGPYDDDFMVREQVGTRKILDNQVELCCLPFYIYGYSLGDILEIDPDTYQVKRIAVKSGRFLYRIMFSCSREEVVKIADQCKAAFGALFEWFDWNFCAVDLATLELAEGFWELMQRLEMQGILEAEAAF